MRKEISKEEKEHEKIAGDYASEKKLSLLTVMEKKQRKISALMQGHTFPFNVLFAIRAWDKSKEGLLAKTTAIKNAINSMNSAQYSESTLPSTSKKLFFQTWPAGLGANMKREVIVKIVMCGRMLPVVTTFTGHLDTAEAIYEGSSQNLVGIKTFSRNAAITRRNTPCCARNEAGRNPSPFAICFHRRRRILLTPSLSKKVVPPSTLKRLNRMPSRSSFNRTALPSIISIPKGLRPCHLSSATALVARMVGVSQHEDKQMLRQAQIAKYLNQLYEDTFQDWSRKNDHRILSIARRACTLSRFRKEKMPPGATMLEAFADLRDWRKTNADEATA